MDTETKILVVSDSKDELEIIVSIISDDYRNIETCLDDDKGIELFDKREPKIVLLCYEAIEHAERFYLGLFRNSEKINTTAHVSIVLCKSNEAIVAYNLCRRDYFDDYVVYKPPYDTNRLRLSMQQSLIRLDLMADCSGSYSRLARFGQVADGLHDAIGTSIDNGKHVLNSTKQSYGELEKNLHSQIDSLQQKLISSEEFKGIVDIRDPDQLMAFFKRFKKDFLSEEFSQAQSSVESSFDEMLDGMQEHYDNNMSSINELHTVLESMPKGILIVDDDIMYQEILRSMLEPEGYRVTTASNGEQAISMMIRVNPDIILMDLNLPGVDGIEITRTIKFHEKLINTPVIMLTGNSQKDTVKKALMAGINDFIVKPSDKATLLQKVRQHLNL